MHDQANVGGELRVDTALFERVEIIRGPASSLYGANAFFAVVNIITRTGAEIDGVSINAEAGTLGTERVQVAVGKRLLNGVDFALSGTRSRSDGVKRLYFPAFDSPATSHGIAEDLDGERVGQMFGRIGFKDLNVTGSFGVRTKVLPTAAYSSLFNGHDPLPQETDRYGAFNGQSSTPSAATTSAWIPEQTEDARRQYRGARIPGGHHHELPAPALARDDRGRAESFQSTLRRSRVNRVPRSTRFSRTDAPRASACSGRSGSLTRHLEPDLSDCRHFVEQARIGDIKSWTEPPLLRSKTPLPSNRGLCCIAEARRRGANDCGSRLARGQPCREPLTWTRTGRSAAPLLLAPRDRIRAQPLRTGFTDRRLPTARSHVTNRAESLVSG